MCVYPTGSYIRTRKMNHDESALVALAFPPFYYEGYQVLGVV